MNEEVFYREVRKTLFNGKLTTLQVSGIQRIVSAWDVYGYGLDTGLCYCLATSYHETGRRMQPVREAYGVSTEDTIRKLDSAWAKGQMTWVKSNYWKAGWFGRGDVQLTHEANYSGPLRDSVKKLFDVDIHADPDAVLRPAISAYILIEGITKGLTTKSDFTKYSLETFINTKKTDYDGARATVNPGEKSSYKPIGDYARKFEAALRAARQEAGEPFKGTSFPMTGPRVQMSSPAKPLKFASLPEEPIRNVGSAPVTVAPTAVVTSVAKTEDGVSVSTEANVPGAEAIEVPTPSLPVTTDSRTGLYDGEYHQELEVIQVMLQAKGWYTLAKPDGKWGDRTASAVLAFRRNCNLPLTDEIDDAFLVALLKSKKREVSAERASATVAEIKEQAPVKDTLTLQSIGQWVMGLGGLGAVGAGGVTSVDISKANESVVSLTALGQSMKAALPFLVVAAVGLGVFYVANRVLRHYLKGYQEGRIA